MSDIIETIKYKNHTINIIADLDPNNPRTDFSNLGTMACFHRRYTLGDKHGYTMEGCQEIENSKEFISLPIYMYDHSGITISSSPFHCKWDSGRLGIIFVSVELIVKEYGENYDPELVKRVLESEIKTYDHYISGDVYSYDILDADDNVIASCGGYYGSDHDESGLMETAKDIIDNETLTPVEA